NIILSSRKPIPRRGTISYDSRYRPLFPVALGKWREYFPPARVEVVMAIGCISAPEWKTFADPVTGVKVRQLTNYKGNSYHLYFTNPGWYDGGRKLLFGSDRENRTNLFSVDLASGEICQLTDLDPVVEPYEIDFQVSCVNPVRDEAYFFHGTKLMALDLTTLETNVLWELPTKFLHTMLNCTADGRYVCLSICQDLSDEIHTDLLRGYVGFAETWAAHPLSRIVRVAVDGSGAETLWEEKSWIGHVNTSPTQANLLTFCHEGPWEKVDNRIWGFDTDTQKAWMIRPREHEGDAVGHEYWHADGVFLGYHGGLVDGSRVFGRVRYDNTDRFEVSFPHETGHIHSNDWSMIVGDAHQVRLWQWNGEGYDGPRMLCEHRSSCHTQYAHVHPRFSPDGSQVLFTSNVVGYCNVYLADVPEFSTLPVAPSDKK
ncbi:MAG TPA: oligogalacturonate lyase family protein, partial [Armatimonadota bacterium]|nr:oligogalacturonate lyase family protein [Armatimonadota bacterium]